MPTARGVLAARLRGDEALEREVLSLVNSQHRAASLSRSSGGQRGVPPRTDDLHCRIIERLGSGGMGVWPGSGCPNGRSHHAKRAGAVARARSDHSPAHKLPDFLCLHAPRKRAARSEA